MRYACSDIHGNREKYEALLQRLALGPEDHLYIIGDVVDRGPEGLRILLDAAERPNVTLLAGNHEHMALRTLRWLAQPITAESTADEELLMARMNEAMEWQQNGGSPTIEEFTALDPSDRLRVLEILGDLDLFAEVQAGGRGFILVHASLGHYEPGKPLEDYPLKDLLWTRPDLSCTLFDGCVVVVGHTPTCFLRAELEGLTRSQVCPGMFPDTVLRVGDLLCIDCRCATGGSLACVCLDTLEEMYV